MKLSMPKRLIGRTVTEVETHGKGSSESASGGEELLLTFDDGTELLVFVHQNGELHVETD